MDNMDNYDNFSQIPDNPVNDGIEVNASSYVLPADQSSMVEPVGEVAPDYVSENEIGWYRRGWGKAIIAIAVLFVLLVVVLLYLLSLNLKSSQSELAPKINANDLFAALSSSSSSSSLATSTASVNSISTAKDPTRLLAEKMDRPLWGNPSSTLVIVEFADFQCPVCEGEFPIIRGFVAKHKDELLYIFRNYIVEDENSNLLAQASLCANDQGKFWILHDKLYTDFGNINSTADLQSLIQSVGMDWGAMSQCIQSGKYTSQVVQDMNDGQSLGVAGTPTFFVNGSKLEGAVTTEDWEAILARYKQITGQNNK